MARESSSEALIRWQKLHLLQDHYSEFLPFLRVPAAGHQGHLGIPTRDHDQAGDP